MWLAELSFVRNEASTAVRRSRWRPCVLIPVRLSPRAARDKPGSGPQSASRYPEGMPSTATAGPRKVLLAAPRGYCAGVDRAVQTVERALELHGAPVYVRKETEGPGGATVVFSAHGVAPAVHDNAAARSLRTIDATCPLVTKVHVSARRFAAAGYTIVVF